MIKDNLGLISSSKQICAPNPTKLTLSSFNNGLEVVWYEPSDISNISKYNVYICQSDNKPTHFTSFKLYKSVDVGTTSIKIQNLINNKRYYVIVISLSIYNAINISLSNMKNRIAKKIYYVSYENTDTYPTIYVSVDLGSWINVTSSILTSNFGKKANTSSFIPGFLSYASSCIFHSKNCAVNDNGTIVIISNTFLGVYTTNDDRVWSGIVYMLNSNGLSQNISANSNMNEIVCINNIFFLFTTTTVLGCIGIYYSIDGISWTASNAKKVSDEVYDTCGECHFIGIKDNIFYAVINGILFYSIDNGVSWIYSPSAYDPMKLSIYKNKFHWLSGYIGNDLYGTSDALHIGLNLDSFPVSDPGNIITAPLYFHSNGVIPCTLIVGNELIFLYNLRNGTSTAHSSKTCQEFVNIYIKYNTITKTFSQIGGVYNNGYYPQDKSIYEIRPLPYCIDMYLISYYEGTTLKQKVMSANDKLVLSATDSILYMNFFHTNNKYISQLDVSYFNKSINTSSLFQGLVSRKSDIRYLCSNSEESENIL